MRKYNIMLRGISKKLFSALMLLIPFSALAVDEPTEKTLKGATIVAGAVLTTLDPVFAQAPGAPVWNSQNPIGVQNIVQFEIDFANSANKYFHNLTFTASINVDIRCYDNPAAPNTVSRTYAGVVLQVNYNTVVGGTYKGIATYKFNGAYKVDVKINGTAGASPFTLTGGLTSANITSYPIFSLTNKLIVTRQYNFVDVTTVATPYTISTNKLDIGWQLSNYKGAESVDIEWTYIDENSTFGIFLNTLSPNTIIPVVSLEAQFRNNCSRVNVAGGSYQFNLNYNNGFLLFRLRGVQYRHADGMRIEGDWNYNADPPDPAMQFKQGIVRVQWHEENLNWQYNASYAEEGKKKEVISYFDGSLRSRQTVTLNNEDKKLLPDNTPSPEKSVAIVAEPVYDVMGRSAMSILPTPVNDNVLKYYKSFNLSNRVGTPPVSYKDILPAATPCVINTSLLSNSSGVEQYYSANNPFIGDLTKPWNQAIPKSEGFPFAVTRYKADNTGRIAAEGGVGQQFQLGSGHETKYYYGKPSQYELDRIFGAEAGDMTHYLKNMVVDANKQVSVSYQNSEGKTIATALAGLPPLNTEALSSAAAPSTTIHDVLLTPSSFQINSAKSSLEASTTFLVSSTGNYRFTYKFTPKQYTEIFSEGTLCYNCSYDLLITIKAECGTTELKRIDLKKITPFSTDCIAPLEKTDFFDLVMNEVGEYNAYFELVVNKETLDQYTVDYLDRNKDIKKLNYFLLQQLIEEDLSQCYSDCEACETLPPTMAEFVTKIQAYYDAEDLPFEADEITYAQNLYTTIKLNCVPITAQCLPSPCEEILDILKEDVTPGGQYAEYDADFNLEDPEINILAKYNLVTYSDEDNQPAMVEDNNGNMVPPHTLSLKEFIQKFEESWAKSLVQFHPEYCYYTWCTMNATSQAYNQKLEELNNPVDAIAGGYFDRTKPLKLIDLDPFFSTGYGVPYVDNMEADLLNYSSAVMNIPDLPVKDIFKTIDYLLYCGNATPVINWATCNKLPNDPCRSDYKEWLIYKEWYMERKLKYYTLAMKNSTDLAIRNCSNCKIPTSGSIDPGSWTNCVPPALSDFTLATVPNSTADGIKRIIIKYKNGEDVTTWPLQLEIQMTNSITNLTLPQTIVFSPGFGSQEVMVQQEFNVFTLNSVKCAQAIVDGRAALSEDNDKLSSIKNQKVSQVSKNVFSTDKPGLNVLNVGIATANSSELAASEFSCPTDKDFTFTTYPSEYSDGYVDICYTGPAIPANKTVILSVYVVSSCGAAVLEYRFCEDGPLCFQYNFPDRNPCVFEPFTVENIECIDEPCTWICPTDPSNYSISTIQSSDPALTELKVCYTGPAIPIDQQVIVNVQVTALDGCGDFVETFTFCSNSATCLSVLRNYGECKDFTSIVKDVYCIEANCDEWQCPESPENYSIQYIQLPNDDWQVITCYLGAPIPVGKKVQVSVIVNTACGEDLSYIVSFCSNTSICNTQTFTNDQVCGSMDAIFDIAYCVDELCDWECPSDPSNYTVTITEPAESENPTTLDIRVCYNGPAIPVGKTVTVLVTINTECGSFEQEFVFCSSSPRCIIIPMDLNGCFILSAEVSAVECMDADCPGAWTCPTPSNNYTVTTSSYPGLPLTKIKVCYSGPAIPADKSVNVPIVVYTSCGIRNEMVTFCSTSPACITLTRNYLECSVTGAGIGAVYCEDKPCGKWQCPASPQNYSLQKKLLSNGDWQILTCYTGPAIPAGTKVKVQIAVSATKGCNPISYWITFCSTAPLCNAYIIPASQTCGAFTTVVVSVASVSCTNEPCTPEPTPCAPTSAFSFANTGSCAALGTFNSANIVISHNGGAIVINNPVKRVKVKVRITTVNPVNNRVYIKDRIVWFTNGDASQTICFYYPLGRIIPQQSDAIPDPIKIIETECSTISCPAGDCCNDPLYSLYEGKVRRFQDYMEPPDFNSVMTGYYNGALNFASYPLMTCKSECETMADGWIQDLKNCVSPADPLRAIKLERVRRKLIDVCKQSCVAQQGNPTIYPYSDVNPLPSFEAVIAAEFGSYTSQCSKDLLSNPYPWGKNPIPENTYATETNTKICTKLLQYRNEAVRPGYATSNTDVAGVHLYLKDFYTPYYDLELSELQDLFRGCIDCNGIMKLPVELPLFLDGEGKPCLTCATYTQVQQQFNVKYPGLPTTDPKYEVLFRNFANHKTGFSNGFGDYADFAEKCQNNLAGFAAKGRLCETPVQATEEINNTQQCVDEKFYNALSSATSIYTAYIEEVKRVFRNNYTTKCLSALASLETDAKLYEYHYTLYYYDQSSNLVKTVPPQGVALLTTDDINALQANRATSDIVPPHTMATTYQYNSFNQVVKQTTPDAGVSEFWYDRLGRLVVSQNAEQKNPAAVGGVADRYSYTKYEPFLGRITEVGEKTGISLNTYDTKNESSLQSWYALGTDKQITETIYDKADLAKVTNTAITNEQADYTSRKRVVATIFKKIRGATANLYDAATHYSYDINGNAKIVWQENTRLKEADASQGLKRMDYDFDLVSGKVNKVFYQKGKGDQFIYKYEYDAENRVTGVNTTRDGLLWQNDANYKYYLHGPLARTELGTHKVQGIDYAYTLQGWMKFINSPTINEKGDIGRDGDNTLANNIFGKSSRDAMGYGISYFNGDFKPVKINSNLFFTENILSTLTGKDLFNGNIRATTLQLAQLGTGKTYSYSYDQLNRIKKMRKHETTYTPVAGAIPAKLQTAPATTEYQENIGYDANGNILTYLRNGTGSTAAAISMDNLSYTYEPGKNRLTHVDDAVNLVTNYGTDIDDQAPLNYSYDKIGNLVKDNAENIDEIEWTVYGKIKKIKKLGASPSTIDYEYDASGNRIYKKVVAGATTTHTFYVRDASGNTMAVYSKINTAALQWNEQHLYGSSRIGVASLNIPVPLAAAIPATGATLADGFDYGKISYELSNHLGNVLVTLTDKKGAVQNGTTGIVNYFAADVVTANDYYPFGMTMPGRSYSATASKYRYGFQNQEVDNELWGGAISFKYRVEDPRLGRFFSKDPLMHKYPWNSPYAFSENRVLDMNELEGLETGPQWWMQYTPAARSAKMTPETWIRINTSKDLNALHMMLDGLGFVPVVGEVADGANALIYTAKGDYLNAAFSSISLAPIGGDLAAKGFKYSLKAAGYEGKAFKSMYGAKKWLTNAMSKGFKVADALQDPRAALQKALGTMNTGKAAHHLVPVEMLEKNKYVQQAVEQGFDFNGVVNGLGLGPDQHLGRHPNSYVAGIEKMIDAAKAAMPKASAKEVMENVSGDLKKMLDGTGKKVNDLFKE